MRRKLTVFFLSVLSCLCLVFGLAACETLLQPTKHDHIYGEWTEVTAPTCSAEGKQTRKCTSCDHEEEGKIDKLPHTFVLDEENSKAPTCVEAGVKAEKCSVCGKAQTSAGDPATGVHNYVADEANSKAPTCSEAGVVAEKCSNCTATKTSAGDPATGIHTWVADAANSKAPTCSEAGVVAEKCSNCTATKTSAGAPATGNHNWVADAANSNAPTCSDAGVVAEKCSDCTATKTSAGDPATGNHTWVLDQANCVAPTCGEAGVKAEKCSVCSATQTSAGDPATGNHTWVLDEANCVAPTCGEAGVKAEKCSDCTATQTSEGDPATGNHTWVLDEANCVAPTCGEAGVKAEKCSVCNKTQTSVGEAATGNHDWVATPEKDTDPTCSEAGKTTYECSVCKQVREDAIVALEHTYKINAEKSVKATCEKAGSNVYECSRCGDSYTETLAQLKHNFTEDVEASKAPTCTEAGTKVYVCANGCKGYTETVDATGHVWVVEGEEDVTRVAADCEDRVCLVCEEKLIATVKHDYVVKTAWTNCVEDGEETIACRLCGKEETRFAAALGHEIVKDWKEMGKTLKEGETCVYEYVMEAECKRCGTLTERKETTIHNYVFTVIEVATCTEAGTKGYICSGCNLPQPDSKTVSYTAEHAWGEPTEKTEGDTVYTLYTCGECSTVRKEFKETIAKVDADALKNEVQLGGGKEDEKGAVISMDQAGLDQIGDATDLTLAANGLSKEEVEAMGKVEGLDKLDENATIYNITLTDSNGDKVLFDNGTVTVKLPYTLQEGEDPACIIVYYLSEKEIMEYEGVYEDGYVVFQTNHFSYYTVGRYTVERICEIYGHNYVVSAKEATCTQAGYYIENCTRCHQDSDATQRRIPALGHNNEITANVAATCTTNGYVTNKCKTCGAEYTVTELAYGHDWVLDEANSKAPSCTEAGCIVEKCANCDASYTEKLAQISHAYATVVTKATCTENGYTTYTCTLCGDSYVGNHTDATGHSWNVEEPTCGVGQICTVCNEAGQPATGKHDMVNGQCTVCNYGCNHDYVLIEKVEANCQSGGYSTYKCSLCEKEETKDYTKPSGHIYDNGFQPCKYCGENNPALAESVEKLFASLASNSYTIKLENLHITAVTDYEDPAKDDVVQMEIEGDIIEAYITIEDDLIKIYAITEFHGVEDGYSGSQTSEVYGDGEYMYVKLREGDRYDYERISYNEMFADMGMDFGDQTITASTPGEMLSGMLNQILGEDLIANWQAAWESNEDLFYTVIGNTFNALFNGETVDGETTFTFNLEAVKKLNENLYNKTIVELFAEYFGETSYEDVRSFVLGLENKTLGNVIDTVFMVAEDHDIPADLIYTTINTIALAATGEEGFDIKTILNDEDMRSMTVSQIVEMLTQMGGGEEGQPNPDTEKEEILPTEKEEGNLSADGTIMTATTDAELTEGEGTEEAFDYAAFVNELFDMLENINVYDMVTQNNGAMLYEMINTFVDTEAISLTVSVNANGEFSGFAFGFKDYSLVVGGGSVGENRPSEDGSIDGVIGGVNGEVSKDEIIGSVDGDIIVDSNGALDTEEKEEEIKDYYGTTSYLNIVTINGSYILLPNGTIPESAATIKAEYEAKMAAFIDVIKAQCELSETKQYLVQKYSGSSEYSIFTLNEDGTLSWVAYDSYYSDATGERVVVGFATIEDFSKASVSFGADCENSFSASYYAWSEFEVYSEEGKTYYYHLSCSMYLYVNPDLAANQVRTESFHNFKEYTPDVIPDGVATSPDEVGCEEYWVYYSKCENCGEVRTEKRWKSHETERRFELVDGAESCEEGVRITYYCIHCGYEEHSYVNYWHENVEHEIVFDTPHGKLTTIYNSCPCGEIASFDFMNYDYEDGCLINNALDKQPIYNEEGNEIGVKLIYNCAITSEDGVEADCPFYMEQYDYHVGIATGNPCEYDRRIEYKFFNGEEQVGETITIHSYYMEHKVVSNNVTTWYDEAETQIESNTNSNVCENEGCNYGSVAVWRYDEEGRTVYYSETRNEDGYTYEYVEEYAYHENGNRSYEKIYRNENSDTSEEIRYYNEMGQLVSESGFSQNSLKDYYYEYSTRYEYDENGNQIFSETNSIDNGINRYSTRECRYDERNRRIYEKYTESDDNGYDYWYSYTTKYITECEYERVYDNSYGEHSVSTGKSHVGITSEWFEATCTQSWVNVCHCEACGETWFESDINYYRGHEWGYFNAETKMQVCVRCGLESATGSSGMIVLEDLTNHEVYVSEGYYTVGYYNSNRWELFDVALMFVTADGEQFPADVSYELTNLNKIYGYVTEGKDESGEKENMNTLLRISKEELVAFAEANGIDLSVYDLSISFIPVGADPEQNYDLITTITLTDLIGAEVPEEQLAA